MIVHKQCSQDEVCPHFFRKESLDGPCGPSNFLVLPSCAPWFLEACNPTRRYMVLGVHVRMPGSWTWRWKVNQVGTPPTSISGGHLPCLGKTLVCCSCSRIIHSPLSNTSPIYLWGGEKPNRPIGSSRVGIISLVCFQCFVWGKQTFVHNFPSLKSYIIAHFPLQASVEKAQ